MTKVLHILHSNVYLSCPLNSFLTFDKASYLHNPLCSVEIVHSGINFSVFSFHNLLGVHGFPSSLLRSLVEHS